MGDLERVDLTIDKGLLGRVCDNLSRYFIMPRFWNARAMAAFQRASNFDTVIRSPASLIVMGDFDSAISAF